ncbi:hypothetical protein VBD025_13705 [Virgibacillus flavescens]|uniref:hypothetical protein n=1 Tax=Virgibacillus flavescens TaxID=1611422 RepID=UPI003D34ED56
MKKTTEYQKPVVLHHQPIRFETSQSWNRGRGPVSGDGGNSDGKHYPHDPYKPKKPHKNK